MAKGQISWIIVGHFVACEVRKEYRLRVADTLLINPYEIYPRADLYAIFEVVLLRWKVIRRIVCTAVPISSAAEPGRPSPP